MMENEKLIVLYDDMAKHTEPECANCRAPHSCCSHEYCEMAIEYAQERYGVTLEPTGHPTLPMMGPNGCTVAPHMRPLCTLHTCTINSVGFKPYDAPWTRKYFKLRNQIDRLEMERDYENAKTQAKAKKDGKRVS